MKVYMGFALVLLVLAGTSVADGQEQTNNGYWWVDQSPTFKIGFATGYAMAMTANSDAAGFRCIAAKHGGIIPQQVPSNEELDACLQSPEVMALDFGKIRMGQLVDGVDEFYKDFRNKSIDIGYAMYYVRDELKGKTDKELAAELAGWRQAANK